MEIRDKTRVDAKRKSGRPARPLSRDDIVAIARRVFAERGFDGANLGEVADLAGIRKPSLYHHFESKLALYTAVLDDDLARLSGLLAVAASSDGSFVDRLDRLGALVVDTLADRPATAQLLVRELMGNGPYLAERGDRAVDILALAASFLAAGMRARAFQKSDPRQLALSIAAVHLFPFATPVVSGAFLGAPLVKAGRAKRKAAVLAQVRRLCGVKR